MNGHDRRRQRIADRIKACALELFLNYGADSVSMDEIAAKADVSKVTIYKYFGSKEDLHREVFNMYFDEILAATEQVLDSDLDFMDKLKIVLGVKSVYPKVADHQAFMDLLDKDDQSEGDDQRSPRNRIKAIIYRFYEQGKREGYIDERVSFDMLYLYYEIVQAGYRAKAADLDGVLADPDALDQLMDLYYFGFIRRR